MTLSEVTGIAGTSGNFTVTVKEQPRYVDVDKCIACGACTEKCPKKVDSEYDAKTGKRKAIYVKFVEESSFRNTQIRVFDLFGRQITDRMVNKSSMIKIPVNVSNTYLIVKVINEGNVVVKKVFVQ